MKIIPELRFPEFQDEGEWEVKPLGNLSDEIVEKTKGRKFKLMSITSGIGLVSQIEKFGREIAGNSYKNYYVIQKSDFAYNKSSTKLYGEGEIAMFIDDEIGAVPNSIFTCFRFDEDLVYPAFAQFPFTNNLHGNWLRKFIAVGARANGALQVKSKDLFSVPFPYPSIPEQQKIAACLSSLDELIAAHSQKLDLLKDHKKGLMQNLFPNPSSGSGGESVPKYRFPKFENDGDWVEKKLGSKEVSFFVNEKVVVDKLSIETYISTENMLADYSGVSIASKLPSSGNFTEFAIGDILISNIRPYLKKVWKADKIGGASNDVLVFRSGSKVLNEFLEFIIKNDAFINYVMESAKGVKMPRGDKDSMQEYAVFIPSKSEQQKIASCLSAVDELITAQAEIIAQLQQHKKGLMQGLFPKMEG
jgi:type I restriction enzyme S subunit